MVQAEQSVIGCLMMAPELLDKARAVLSPAMFEAQPLARIFSCMLELKKAGTPVDAVTVVSRLGTAMRPLSGSARASRRALARSRNTPPSCWTRGGSARW